MRHSAKKAFFDCIVLVGLACCMALNYQIFILHNAFAPAGINGIATMIQYLFDFSVGYMSLLINIPLSVVSFFLVDRQFSVKTLVFSLTFSLALLLMQKGIVDVSRFVYVTPDCRSTLLAPIASGTINGFIYGAVIHRGGSTGGTDFIAAFIHKKRPEFSMMRIIFTLNAAVAILSYFVYNFNIEPVILCIAYCFITSNVSDRILRGGKQAIKVEIITSHPEEISETLIRELRHSVTILPAKGGFSHTEKSMLVCVINKHQITRFNELISCFPDTFAYASNVNETMGNFKHITR